MKKDKIVRAMLTDRIAVSVHNDGFVVLADASRDNVMVLTVEEFEELNRFVVRNS